MTDFKNDFTVDDLPTFRGGWFYRGSHFSERQCIGKDLHTPSVKPFGASLQSTMQIRSFLISIQIHVLVQQILP